nr:hypothetical protein [Tanacetum cinerariifolium]
MADLTVVGSVHNLDHGSFAFGYSCGRSLKASDASDLVSPTPIINMSRAGNHEELLPGMTNNIREAATDTLSISIQDKPGSYIAAAGGSRPKPSALGGSKQDPKDVLKESLTIDVHLIEDMRFTIKTVVSIPINVVTPVVPAPIVEITNDGFQTVGKKKKGKSKSINSGRIGGHFVKKCTPLGYMADLTVVGSVHNSDHGSFAFGYSCGGSLKASDASALVSPTPIINMSRAGNHEELLPRMTNNIREAATDALSISIQDKPGSYIATAGGSRPKPSALGGSKQDPSISKVFSKDGLSIITSQIEDVLKESLTIDVHLIEDTRFTIKTVGTIEYE